MYHKYIINNKITDYYLLSSNPNAIHILEQNLNKVDWRQLSENPNAIHLLEKNIDKMNWSMISSNPNAIHILEKNLDKVDWNSLSSNPNAIHLFAKLDHIYMKQANDEFLEELVQYVFKPERLWRLCEQYNIEPINIDEYI